MKKIIYTMAIASIAMISAAKAQVSIGVGVNIGAPVAVAPAPVMAGPAWIPAGAASPYYFFPDINCYYDMGVGQYIYFENNRWLYSRAIPPRFAGYNFRGHMVPMNHRVFASRGIHTYRGGGRPMIVNHNNYIVRDRGPQHFNNGNHFGNGRGGGNFGGHGGHGRH